MNVDDNQIVNNPSNNFKFDKSICLSNIRYLISTSSVKIGDIEDAAGVSRGYMSRLEKNNNTSTPSIEFVVAAAKKLNVSVDSLLYSDFSQLNNTDLYILKFIEKLSRETATHNLKWISEGVSTMNACFRDFNIDKLPSLLRLLCPDATQEYEFTYNSRFIFSEYNIKVTEPCYHSSIPDSLADIYINPCRINKNSGQAHSTFEIYLIEANSEDQNKQQLLPLCSTYFTNSTIHEAVRALYMQIKTEINRVHLDSSTIAVINRFLDRT